MYHFHRQIDKLKKQLLNLGTLVEDAVHESIQAIQNRDADLADRVIEGDKKIDLMEIDVEEECLHTLALHQPVAVDLRFVVAVLKINHDLERIGDLAASIARQAKFLASEAIVEQTPFDLPGMCTRVTRMLHDALDALVSLDVESARKVRKLDDEVDEIYARMYDELADAMRQRPDQMEQMIHLMNVARQLERMADHAVNIAKDVVYMVEGEIVRHRRVQRERAEAAAEQTG